MEEVSDVRLKQRVVIDFLTAEKFPPTEIHRRMQAIYGVQCVHVSTARRLGMRFKNEKMAQADLSDRTRIGRPVTVGDLLLEDRVEEMIRGNPRIKKRKKQRNKQTNCRCIMNF
jgi:hypothetical protein